MKNKVIFLIIVMFFFNGLNNARELNTLAIVSAVGIDIDDEGNYIITAQVLNTKKNNSSGSGSGSLEGSSNILKYKSKSKTSVQNALRNMIEELPRRLYLAHMEVLLISEKIAKEDNILETLNFFIRDNEGSNNFMLLITKDTTPEEVLNTVTPMESDSGKSIKDTVVTTQKYESTATENILSENLAMFLNDKSVAIVSSIELDDSNDKIDDTKENIVRKKEENNENEESTKKNNSSNEEDSKSEEEKEETKIKVSNMGYFKDGKLKGYITKKEAFLYNLLNDSAKNAIIKYGDNDNLLVVEMIKEKLKKEPKLENGKYSVDINLEVICNVTEVGFAISLDTEADINENEKVLASYLKEEIEKFITKCKKEYDADLVGLENLFYRYKNKEYKTLEKMYDKDEIFKNIETNVNVKVKIPNEGGIYNVW